MDNVEQIEHPINNFTFEGVTQNVSFKETVPVADGVECDTYVFDKDGTKDLGIIRVKPGKHTPLQRVKKGDRTIEGFRSGKGKLTITKLDGTQEIYVVGEKKNKPFSLDVGIGDLMQWEADPDSELIAYEVCYPPYEEGRYENIG